MSMRVKECLIDIAHMIAKGGLFAAKMGQIVLITPEVLNGDIPNMMDLCYTTQCYDHAYITRTRGISC